MNPHHKAWNQQQKALRQALQNPSEHHKALELFLIQHAMVHSTSVSQLGLWSFADEVWQDMNEEAIRRIPQNCDHSVAWVMWHIARIEDVTTNMLVAGRPQVLHQADWRDRIKVAVQHTGNAMEEKEVIELSASIDIAALRAYRVTVGRGTREIVRRLTPEALKQKVQPDRLQRVLDQGVVVEAAWGIVEYWSRRDIAGLLLMPPTRHNFIHLNEAARLKQRRR
jgi:hypothetical protein